MKLNKWILYGAVCASAMLVFYGFMRDGYSIKLSAILTVLTWVEPVIFGIVFTFASYKFANEKKK